MSEDDLKNLKELRSKNKPRILTMYFEDGGEASVIPYDDYYDLQQENQQLKERVKTLKETQLKQLNIIQQRDEVIDEILNFSMFTNECPFSLVADDNIHKLCDCENCQDTYKECWLKYFKNEIQRR